MCRSITLPPCKKKSGRRTKRRPRFPKRSNNLFSVVVELLNAIVVRAPDAVGIGAPIAVANPATLAVSQILSGVPWKPRLQVVIEARHVVVERHQRRIPADNDLSLPGIPAAGDLRLSALRKKRSETQHPAHNDSLKHEYLSFLTRELLARVRYYH